MRVMNCPILNKTQKRIRLTALFLIALVFFIWIYFGGEFFTKTQILVEVNDEIFGTTKEWKDKFVLGLDLTLLTSGIITAITLPLLYFTRTKNKSL